MSKCPIEKISVINEPFEKWAERTGENITNLYVNNNKIFKDILIVVYDRITVAVNLKHKHIGIARCHKNDMNKTAIGVTIAFYRMMCWELPKVQRVVEKSIYELKKGDRILSNSTNQFVERIFIDYFKGKAVFWDIVKMDTVWNYTSENMRFKVLEED